MITKQNPHLVGESLGDQLARLSIREDRSADVPALAPGGGGTTTKKKKTSGSKKKKKGNPSGKEEDAVGKKKPVAIHAQWDTYFGDERKLENWQRLCRDLSIDPVPNSLTKCRKALNGDVWVNICDFLENHREGRPQTFFATQKALAKYTRQSGKIFPKKKAKEMGPIRDLLARIF